MRRQLLDANLKCSFSYEATLHMYSLIMNITRFKTISWEDYRLYFLRFSIINRNCWSSQLHQLAAPFPRYGCRKVFVSHRQRYAHNLCQTPWTSSRVVYSESRMLRLSSTSLLRSQMLLFIHFLRIERVSSQFGLPTFSSSQSLLSKASNLGTLPIVLVLGNSPKTLFASGWNSLLSAHRSQNSCFFNYASSLGIGPNYASWPMMMVNCYKSTRVLLLLSWMIEALAEMLELFTVNANLKMTPLSPSPATRRPTSSFTSLPSLKHCRIVLISSMTAILLTPIQIS